MNNCFLSETDQIQKTDMPLIRTEIFNFYNQFNMERQATIQAKAKKYAKISLQRRLKLIQLIDQLSITIARAARKLGIKLSTAKLILKKYREDGTFFEKRQNRIKRLEALKGSSLINFEQKNEELHPQYCQIYHNMLNIDECCAYNPFYLCWPNNRLGNQQNFYTSFLQSGKETYPIYYAVNYHQL